MQLPDLLCAQMALLRGTLMLSIVICALMALSTYMHKWVQEKVLGQPTCTKNPVSLIPVVD